MTDRLKTEFYDALVDEIAERFDGHPGRAFKSLRGGKKLIQYPEECRGEAVQPQAATLQAFIQNGGPRLRTAAQAWLDLIQSPAATEDVGGDFGFLYVGMQLLLADYDALLRGCIHRESSEDLEELAAIGLVRSYIIGHYYWGVVNCAGHLFEPVVPDELLENEEDECIRAARELLTLAQFDERVLYERLDAYLAILMKRVELSYG